MEEKRNFDRILSLSVSRLSITSQNTKKSIFMSSTPERISALSSSDRKLWSHLKSIVEEDEGDVRLGPDVQISKKEIKRELREEETSKEDTDNFFREYEKRKKKSTVSRREREQIKFEKHAEEEERPSMLDALKMLDPNPSRSNLGCLLKGRLRTIISSSWRGTCRKRVYRVKVRVVFVVTNI